MTRIDDEMLIAFADGELDSERRALVEAALAADPSLRDRLDRQQRLRRRIFSHYAPVAAEAVPDRFTSLLGVTAAANGQIVSLAEVRQRRARPAWMDLTALAATLVLGLFGGALIPSGSTDPFALEQGSVVADGALADALETRLASEPARGDTRIGVTFAAVDGRICRTFDSVGVSGLACRGTNGWRIEAAVAASGADGEFRQASSGNSLLLATAQDLMAGEPFDAEAERRALARGWKN